MVAPESNGTGNVLVVVGEGLENKLVHAKDTKRVRLEVWTTERSQIDCASPAAPSVGFSLFARKSVALALRPKKDRKGS